MKCVFKVVGGKRAEDHIGVFRTALTGRYENKPPETLSISRSIPETAAADGPPGVCQHGDI
jgi:hypothetical protein